MLIKPIGSQYISMDFSYYYSYYTRVRGVRGTGSAGPQQMLIFWVLLIFLVNRKRLTYHAAITDGIACRPLNYGVWNACETLCVNIRLRLPTKDVEET